MGAWPDRYGRCGASGRGPKWVQGWRDGVVITGKAGSETLWGGLGDRDFLTLCSGGPVLFLQDSWNLWSVFIAHHSSLTCHPLFLLQDSHLIHLCLCWQCLFLLSAPSRMAHCEQHELWSISCSAICQYVDISGIAFPALHTSLQNRLGPSSGNLSGLMLVRSYSNRAHKKVCNLLDTT